MIKVAAFLSAQIQHVTTTTPLLPTALCGDLRFQKQPPVQLSLLQLWPDHDIIYGEAYHLEEKMRDQIYSDKWFACRHRRITTSDFHKVYTRKKAVAMKFLKRLYDTANFYNSSSFSIPTTTQTISVNFVMHLISKMSFSVSCVTTRCMCNFSILGHVFVSFF